MDGVIEIICDWDGETKPLTVTDRVARELGLKAGDVASRGPTITERCDLVGTACGRSDK